jgi:hypothetical protein
VARDCRRDRRHDLAVASHARPGRVEVDHVEPPGTARLEGLRTFDGVGAVNGLTTEIAFGQAHAPARPQVYRREEFHGYEQALTKLAIIPRPTVEDFSGWNWVAQTVPRSAAAATEPPYSQVATVSSPTGGAYECTK